MGIVKGMGNNENKNCIKDFKNEDYKEELVEWWGKKRIIKEWRGRREMKRMEKRIEIEKLIWRRDN